MRPLSCASLEQIVQSSVHGILVLELNGSAAQIRYANAAYERESGYRSRELVGQSWSRHFAEDSVEENPAELKRQLTIGLPAVRSFSCLRKDGSVWRSDVHLSRLGSATRDSALILAQHVVASEDARQWPETNSSEPSGSDNVAPPSPTTERHIGGDASATLGPAAPKAPAVQTAAAGMLAPDQFIALLTRDLAIARRHGRMVTLLLFEIAEFEVYRGTFGPFAAEACARMIGTQIVGTFARSIDLRTRLEESLFAVAIHEQDRATALRMAQIVADKTARLGLHNPRGCFTKQIELLSTCVEADPENEGASELLDRSKFALHCGTSDSVVRAAG